MSTTVVETVTSKTPPPGTNESSYVPRGPVSASLNFYAPPADGSNPWNYVQPQLPGEPQRNYGDEPRVVRMEDIRGCERDFTLEIDAFQAVSGVLSEQSDFIDDDDIKRVYYPEVEKLIFENVPGSYKVTIFDHTIRRSIPDATRPPVNYVHIDQTARSSAWRVKLHDPEHAEELLKGRCRIINVWRPINGIVQNNPLGFASAYTVRNEDVISVEHRYPDRIGESASVRFNNGQKFYYWSGMDNDERLLLKCFDSKLGVGQRVPHTAFVDTRSPAGAKGRESIEVRALVYG